MKRLVIVSLAACGIALACSKPPKTSADVDTMREASFVKDIHEDGGARGPTVQLEPADGDGPAPATSASTSPTPRAPPPEIAPSRSKPAGREKITRAECTRMFEHFFDLVLASDPRFADLGADGKAMVRQLAGQDPSMASLQKDCETDVPRAKFDCAMAAKAQSAWQDCLK